MKSLSISLTALLVFAVAPSIAQAEEVKVSGVHNCCGACCKLIQDTLAKVEGVSECTAKPKESDFTFQAANAKAARQAIAALARVGFHGKTNQKKGFPANSGVEAGKVERLSLMGIHNCCAGCSKAAKEVIAKVEGVAADTLEPNKRKFVVEGNFDGAALVAALNDAGFHVRKEGAAKAQAEKKKKDSE